MRRLALVAVAVLLVACSDSNDATSNPGSTLDPHTSTTIVVGPDGSSSVVVVGPDGNPTDTTTGASSSSSDGTPSIASNGPVGSYAATILNSAVTVEVRTQSGAEPNGSSIDHLVSVLGGVAEGPVSPTRGGGLAGGAKEWSADELRALGTEGGAQSAGNAVLHLLFVHGTFEGNDSVLGAAVQGDTAAIFVDRINDAATPLIGSPGIQTAVLTHEVGHLLGLVDLALHTGRQDPEHPGHSTNQQSVMYWAVESSLITDVLTGGPPTDFDNDDLADLETIRSNG